MIIKKLGHRFKMALTDQNFTIKIAKRENIEEKIGSWNEKKKYIQRVVLYLAASFSILVYNFYNINNSKLNLHIKEEYFYDSILISYWHYNFFGLASWLSLLLVWIIAF